MIFFGIVFIVSTILIFIFKKEINSNDTEIKYSALNDTVNETTTQESNKSYEETLNLKETYKLMWKILWLAPIKTLTVILLTVKVDIPKIHSCMY